MVRPGAEVFIPLQADIAKSLQARVDVLLAEAEEGGQGDALIQPPGEDALTLSLPRRALFPIAVQFHPTVPGVSKVSPRSKSVERMSTGGVLRGMGSAGVAASKRLCAGGGGV